MSETSAVGCPAFVRLMPSHAPTTCLRRTFANTISKRCVWYEERINRFLNSHITQYSIMLLTSSDTSCFKKILLYVLHTFNILRHLKHKKTYIVQRISQTQQCLLHEMLFQGDMFRLPPSHLQALLKYRSNVNKRS